MNRRPSVEGKPFLRVPLREPVKSAPKTKPYTKPKKPSMTAEDLQKGAVERGNREQARESIMPKRAKGGKVMKHASKAGNAMKKKSADTMGRAMVKKYAKGGTVGKADGCAVKGKTHTKMVKMAMGGKAGYKRGGKTC